jgi:2-polyprenyl-3-methyl-5-hydroxy-6-metoxy-1,4-benzoquinol methylase
MKSNKQYEAIERRRYSGFWRSLRGGFSADTRHYSSQVPDAHIVRLIKEAARHHPSGAFLDIGCGNGRHTIAAAHAGLKAQGIDIAQPAIDIANTHAKLKGVDAFFEQASALHLPFKKNSFHIVLDAGCLHHLRKQQWRAYRTNVDSILRPGGDFILLCFSATSGFVPKVRPKNRNWQSRNGHFNYFFTEHEAEHLLRRDYRVLSKQVIKKPDSPLVFYLYHFRKNLL